MFPILASFYLLAIFKLYRPNYTALGDDHSSDLHSAASGFLTAFTHHNRQRYNGLIGSQESSPPDGLTLMLMLMRKSIMLEEAREQILIHNVSDTNKMLNT